MPYCCQCGNQVGVADRFCGVCGNAQAAPASTTGVPPGTGDPLSSLSSRNASLLCYIPVVGGIAAIWMLAATRFRRDQDVRFNAFQGFYIFVAWLIVDQVLSPLMGFGGEFGFHFGLGRLLKAVLFGIWIFMIVKVSHGESYRLPVLGELAERSVSEQR